MSFDLQPAYVLHSRPYRDSSALVDLLTLREGMQRVAVSYTHLTLPTIYSV